jgi:hypothetical protein
MDAYQTAKQKSKLMKTKYYCIASAGWVALMAFRATAQLVLSGTNYTQNFDALASGLPQGWTVRTDATAGFLGDPAGFVTAATSWNNTIGQFANAASTISNRGTNFLGDESSTVQAGCTNRALQVQQVNGNGSDPGAAFVLQILNTTNRYNFQLNLDFLTLDVENRAATWTVDYAVGPNPTAFIPVGTFTDPDVFGKIGRTFTLPTGLENQLATVWVRIASLSTNIGSGARNMFGIDNFALSWQPTPSAPVVALHLNIQPIAGQVVLSWTNQNCVLQTAAEVSGTYVDLSAATSPYTNAVSESQRYFRLKAN